MTLREIPAYLLWRYFHRNPRLYGLYTAFRYSDRECEAKLIGATLTIVPRKEPTYFTAARQAQRNQLFRDEARNIIAIAALLRPGSTFVDCGANVGLWAASLARLAPLIPDLKVLAFEANRDTFTRLLASCRHHKNARCINVALSDSRGEIEMTEGGSSLVFGIPDEGGWNKGGRAHRVKTAPLDDYVADCADIVIKLDVEGHEWPVLLGARRAIEEGRVRAIFVDGLRPGIESDCVAFLDRSGFDIRMAADLSPYSGGTEPIIATRVG